MNIQEFKRRWVYRTALGDDGFKIPYKTKKKGNILIINFILFGKPLDFSITNNITFTIHLTNTYNPYSAEYYNIPVDEREQYYFTEAIMTHTYDQDKTKKFPCPVLKQDGVEIDYYNWFNKSSIKIINGEIINSDGTTLSFKLSLDKTGPVKIIGIPNGVYQISTNAYSNKFFQTLDLQQNLFYNDILPSEEMIYSVDNEPYKEILDWTQNNRNSIILKNNNIYPVTTYYYTGKSYSYNEKFKYYGYFVNFFTENKFSTLNITYTTNYLRLILYADIIIDDFTEDEQREWESVKEYISIDIDPGGSFSYQKKEKKWKGIVQAKLDKDNIEIIFPESVIYYDLKFYSNNPSISISNEEYLSYILNNNGEYPNLITLHYKKPNYYYWRIQYIDIPSWVEPENLSRPDAEPEYATKIAVHHLTFDDDNTHIQGEYALGFRLKTKPSDWTQYRPYDYYEFDKKTQTWTMQENIFGKDGNIAIIETSKVIGGPQVRIKPDSSKKGEYYTECLGGYYTAWGHSTSYGWSELEGEDYAAYIGYSENRMPIENYYDGHHWGHNPPPAPLTPQTTNYLYNSIKILKDGSFIQQGMGGPFAYYVDGNISDNLIKAITCLKVGYGNEHFRKIHNFLSKFLKEE